MVSFGGIVGGIKNIISPPKQSTPTPSPTTYKSPSGNIYQDRPNNPQTGTGGMTKIISNPSPTAGYSSNPSTALLQNQANINQVRTSDRGGGGGGSNLAGAVTATNAQGTMQGSSFLNAVNQNQVQQSKVQASNPVDIIRRTAGSAGAAIVSGYNTALDIPNRQTGINQQAMNLQGGVREVPFTKSGRGTIQQVSIPYSTKELQNLPTRKGTSEQAVNLELQRREEVKIQTAFNNYIQPVSRQLGEEGQQRYNLEIANLQLQLNEGSITEAEANKRSAELAEGISKFQNQKLQNIAQGWVDTKGQNLSEESKKYLEKLADERALKKFTQNIPIYAAAGFGAGAGLTTIASTGAVASGIVSAVNIAGGTYAGVSAAASLGSSYISGTLTATKVASVLIPFAAFGGGAVAGSRFVTGAAIDPIKLNNAISNADVVYKPIKGTITEIQIAALKIPEGQKAQLIKIVRMGGSVKAYSGELKAQGANAAENQKLINKVNPEIRTYEITTNTGKTFQVGSVVNVKTTKGLITKKENIVAAGKGVQEQNKAIADILSARATNKGKVLEIQKTRQFSKTGAIENNFERVVFGKSLTAEVATKQVPKKGVLTQKDLTEVAQANIPKKLLSQTQFAEYQQLKGKPKIRAARIKDIALIGVQRTFETKAGRIITKKIPQPSFEYENLPKSKAIKNLPEYPKLNINFPKPKGVKTPKAQQVKIEYPGYVGEPGTQAIESVYAYNKNFLDNQKGITGFSGVDLSNAIKNSIGGGYANPKGSLYPAELNKKVGSRALNAPIFDTDNKIQTELRKLARTKTFTTTPSIQPSKFGYGIKQPQINIVTPKLSQTEIQIQKQIQKLNQIPKQSFKFQPIPITELEVPIVPPPFLGGRGLGEGNKNAAKRLMKQRKKATSQYTASLAAAFLQAKPIKVTPEQYKQLSEKNYTGFETRPIVSVDFSNSLKNKKNSKVSSVDFGW